MANPISVERFHAEVVKFYEHAPRILYSEEGGANYTAVDCRGVILGAVRNAGYEDFRFAGTNDFWNNFCMWRGTPEEAKKLGYWKPGLILFNLDESTGKTTHMGVLTDRRKTLYPDIEQRSSGDIINSSKSKNGMILSDSEASGGWWNRCALALEKVIDYAAWLGEADYGDADASDPDADETPAIQSPLNSAPQAPSAMYGPGPGQAMVITTTSGLYLRKLPGKDGEKIKEMPIGTIVTVLRVAGIWAQVRWNVKPGLWHDGWCCVGENGTDYLQFG